jgi:hypothetical protein
VVEGDAVEDALAELVVLQALGLRVEVVVAAGADPDVALGELVPGLRGGALGVLPGGHEHERLAVLLEVGLGEVQRAVESAVLVRE